MDVEDGVAAVDHVNRLRRQLTAGDVGDFKSHLRSITASIRQGSSHELHDKCLVA